jgi:outer membrane protein TolC
LSVLCAAILLAASHALSGPLSAGEAVTLEGLLEEALSSNPGLKSLGGLARAKDARARAEGYLDDPTFEVEMMGLPAESPLNLSPWEAMQTRYRLKQMLPFPGKLALRAASALKEAGAAKEALKSKELELAFMVKEAYFDYAHAAEAVDAYLRAKDVATRMARTAEARYSLGEVSQQDVIRAHLESAMISNEIIMVEAASMLAATRIKALLGRGQDGPLGPPARLPRERPAFDADALARAALHGNPDIRAAELEAEAAGLNAELAGKDRYPDFMVGIAPVQTGGTFDSFDFMVGLTLPVWRQKYSAVAEGAGAEAVAMKAASDLARTLKALEIKAAAIEVEAAERAIALYETGLMPQAGLSFESALRNYQSGRVDFLMLLDAEREVRRTEIGYLAAILEYRKKAAALEKAAGVAIR